MEDINVDVDYFTHPKTLRLIGLLGRGAEVYPIKLWCWAAKYHSESGLLAGYSDEEVESVIGWTGERGLLVASLKHVGFIEKNELGVYVHDFSSRNGHIAAFKARARRAADARWSKLRGSDAPSNATSTPQAMLEQCPTYRPTVLPETATAEARQETKIPAAAAVVDEKAEKPPEKHDPMAVVTSLAQSLTAWDFSWLHGMLLHEWGKAGHASAQEIEDLVALGKANGVERLKYAIHQAALHNKKSVAYVKGILEPKAKLDPVAIEKISTCRQCGHKWDWKAEGTSLCPICYPSTKIRKAD
jgi:hypothetical protein